MEKYDVFISYKHTDIYGNLTEDSHIAEDIYNSLRVRGIAVFLADKR